MFPSQTEDTWKVIASNIKRINQLKKGHDINGELSETEIKKSKNLTFISKLDNLTDNCFIVIHDAARSFLSSELLTSLVKTAKEHGSAAPYLDNSKFYDIQNEEIVTQKKIVDIQTPQVYKYKELFECYSFLSKNKITGMVDTTESMFNFNKFETHVIKGEDSNLKITYKSDLEIIKKVII